VFVGKEIEAFVFANTPIPSGGFPESAPFPLKEVDQIGAGAGGGAGTGAGGVLVEVAADRADALLEPTELVAVTVNV